MGPFIVFVMGLAPGLAHADEKPKADKKPGLFDFESWKSPVARERDASRRLAPASLDLTPARPHPAEPRAIRVRVYADDDYRGLVLRWQSRLRAQLQRVNGVVEPVFGVSFQIESIRSWTGSHASAAFAAIIAELQALDAGRDVELVVGLVTPARGVVTDVHQIGIAATPGRHIVLRGMDDEQEGLAIDHDLSLLAADEREALYTQRRAHKEAVIFLHEWGHTMGLAHEEDRVSIMNPLYDPLQSRFSELGKDVVVSTLDARVAHPAGDVPAAPRPPVARQPDAAFQAAAEALAANRPEDAWNAMAPAVERLGGTADAATWTRVAQLAAGCGALTAAEEAMAHVPRGAPEIERVAMEVETTRQRVALPPSPRSGVAAGREPAFVAGYYRITRLVSAGDLPGAQARFKELAGAFPDAPGIDVLACDLELRAGHAASATRRCDSALAKYRFAVRAHVLLGMAAARAGHGAVAAQHLETAIRLDPHDAGTWQALDDVYRAQRARSQREQLALRYRAVFGAALP
ncbi:MAG: matrixin family metalloprotease [Polyangia bacterium]